MGHKFLTGDLLLLFLHSNNNIVNNNIINLSTSNNHIVNNNRTISSLLPELVGSVQCLLLI